MKTQLEQKYFPYEHWTYSNSEIQTVLKIVPQRGGLVTEWINNNQKILYFDIDRYLNPGKSVRGGIPILFPICGNLIDNKFAINNRIYTMNQHGFARDMEWNMKQLRHPEVLRISLLNSEKTFQSFPYLFNIDIDISITSISLIYNIKITNLSNSSMPFSFGLHPYFNITNIRTTKIIGLSELALNHLNGSNEDTSILINKLNNGVDFMSDYISPVILRDDSHPYSIEMTSSNNFSHTVVWTDPPREMICLEPWTSPRFAMNTSHNLLYVEPSEIKELFCKFSLVMN